MFAFGIYISDSNLQIVFISWYHVRIRMLLDLRCFSEYSVTTQQHLFNYMKSTNSSLRWNTSSMVVLSASYDWLNNTAYIQRNPICSLLWRIYLVGLIFKIITIITSAGIIYLKLLYFLVEKVWSTIPD
jgi:hypothetical protein